MMKLKNSSTLPQSNRISIYGIPPAFGPMDGYAYAGLKIVLALKELGYEVPWRDEESPISISFCQPDWYSHEESQFRIGYTPWESTIIPEWWVKELSEVDVLWTTSNWCKDVFLDNGVDNIIQVVPHGIDTEEWAIDRRKVPGRFTFMHMGEPASRKNGQMAFDAFTKVFGKNSDVEFLMKANGYSEARNREPWGPVTINPRVRLITERISVPHLSSLFLSAHCFLYPSNGEGFGMIPFQAIATGMPTLLPKYSGMADFADYGIPLDFTEAASGHNYHVGKWCFPSFDDLCDKMKYVYENYDSVAESSYKSGLELRERFRWKDIIKNSLSTL